jgi:hypothetical protein
MQLSFTAHPASVGESYTQHLGSAFGFAFRMLGGGLACLVHGVFPFLFTGTGSGVIRQLHETMVLKRSAAGPARTAEPLAGRSQG